MSRRVSNAERGRLTGNLDEGDGSSHQYSAQNPWPMPAASSAASRNQFVIARFRRENLAAKNDFSFLLFLRFFLGSDTM